MHSIRVFALCVLEEEFMKEELDGKAKLMRGALKLYITV